MMRRPCALAAAVSVLLLGEVAVVCAMKPEGDQAAGEKGRIIYQRSCSLCHGIEGKGDGPAGWFIGRYSSPRPRDLTGESFKLRSTASGELPTDQDLFRTISRGIPGVMPPFSGLTEDERWAVIAYVKSFNPLFLEGAPTPLAMAGPPVPFSQASVKRGREIYQTFGCPACHEDYARERRAPIAREELRDARGLAIQAADLTAPSSFKNGSRPEDIYRTLMTGLDGTPMPAYAHDFEGREDDLWHLVNYVLSLSAPPP